jgi:hypothetical protein
VGTFVTVQGQQSRFFGIVTDLDLASADPRFAATAPNASPAIADILSGTSTFAIAKVTPTLALSSMEEAPKPARSLPGHFAKVRRATNDDVQAVFGSASLDEEDARRRGVSTDFIVQIGYDEIEPEDIAILAPTLNITDLGVQAAYSLVRHFKNNWVSSFLAIDDMQGLADQLHESQSTLDALRRRLAQFQRFGFLSEGGVQGKGAVATLMDYLDRGIHVVLEFGRYGDSLAAYLLVANLITRRIHDQYRRRTEEALASSGKEPLPLVITIEEAHRFLSPQLANQTIFGTIAREMRKYHVTLLVVDQRPSGIDQEVMSQVGTRIICQLDNDRDVDAVLTGAPGARELKTVLSRLEAQQQALIFGHALPMPVVVRTRNYDQSFYSEFSGGFDDMLTVEAQRKKDKEDLFG